jgi:hypothetical protein
MVGGTRHGQQIENGLYRFVIFLVRLAIVVQRRHRVGGWKFGGTRVGGLILGSQSANERSTPFVGAQAAKVAHRPRDRSEWCIGTRWVVLSRSHLSSSSHNRGILLRHGSGGCRLVVVVIAAAVVMLLVVVGPAQTVVDTVGRGVVVSNGSQTRRIKR